MLIGTLALVLLPPSLAASAAGPGQPGLVNVELDHTDIHAALRFLADLGEVNLVVGDDVKGSVTLQLHRVTWDEAFYAVLSQDGLAAAQVGSTWEVHPR